MGVQFVEVDQLPVAAVTYAVGLALADAEELGEEEGEELGLLLALEDGLELAELLGELDAELLGLELADEEGEELGEEEALDEGELEGLEAAAAVIDGVFVYVLSEVPSLLLHCSSITLLAETEPLSS